MKRHLLLFGVLFWLVYAPLPAQETAGTSGLPRWRLYVMPQTLLSVEPRLRMGMEYRLSEGFSLNLSSDLNFYNPYRKYASLSDYHYLYVNMEFKHYYGRKKRGYWAADFLLLRRSALKENETTLLGGRAGIVHVRTHHRIVNYRGGMNLTFGSVIPWGKTLFFDFFLGTGPRVYYYDYTLMDKEYARPDYEPFYDNYIVNCLGGLPFFNTFLGNLLRQSNNKYVGWGVSLGLRIGIHL